MRSLRKRGVGGATSAALVPGVLIVWGFAEDTLEAASLGCLKAGLESGVLLSGVPRFLEGHGVYVVIAQMGEQWPVGIETGNVDAGNMQNV